MMEVSQLISYFISTNHYFWIVIIFLLLNFNSAMTKINTETDNYIKLLSNIIYHQFNFTQYTIFYLLPCYEQGRNP